MSRDTSAEDNTGAEMVYALRRIADALEVLAWPLPTIKVPDGRTPSTPFCGPCCAEHPHWSHEHPENLGQQRTVATGLGKRITCE